MWNCGLLWNCGLVLTILLSKTNISKTIRCMPMKSSQVDGMVNVCYTFVVMETNCDVIMTSSVKTIRIRSSSKKDYFFAVLLTYISYYINKQIYLNGYVLIFLIFLIYFYFYRNSVLVGVQKYSVTFCLPNIFTQFFLSILTIYFQETSLNFRVIAVIVVEISAF